MPHRKKQQATSQWSLEQTIERLPQSEAYAGTVLARLDRIRPLKEGAAILDVGAAQGRFVVACVRQGYRAVGVEPWHEARDVATRLGRHVGVDITVLEGIAENLPFESERFDIVHASNVMEHVLDAEAAFKEAYRVLKPGGVFWFSSASSMCPRQDEIRGFPCFGWYPDRLKRRIMEWAKTKRPHLVGHTETPAINWFTPWKAGRMLRKAGFRAVYDRWDLRLPAEGGKAYRLALRFVRLCAVTKIFADVVMASCSYAAIK